MIDQLNVPSVTSLERLHKVNQSIDTFKWHVVVQGDAAPSDPVVTFEADETRSFCFLGELGLESSIINSTDAERDIDTRTVTILDRIYIEPVGFINVFIQRSGTSQ